MLGALELVLQVGCHYSSTGQHSPIPHPAGHIALDAAQDPTGFLGCECMWAGHAEFVINHHVSTKALIKATQQLHIWIIK